MKHFSISTSGGMLGISDEDSNTLDMNFVKFGVSYSNKFKKKYNENGEFRISCKVKVFGTLTVDASYW